MSDEASKETSASARERRAGFLVTLFTFVAWGLIPIYWKALAWVPPVEVVCHRVLWSTLFLAGFVTARRRWPAFARSVRTPRLRRLLGASGALIGVNWAVFIWAVNTGRILETSLAYYMTPLLNVLIGYALFSERLRRLQLVALVLAAAGVANLAVAHGEPPWAALAMAASFALYGAARKAAGVDAVDGLFFENALLLPVAAAYLLWQGQLGRILTVSLGPAALLAGSGVITSVPLAAFGFGVRRIRLVTVGLLQFISPSLSFLLGVFVYREPFAGAQLLTFVLIWVGVAAYAVEGVWGGKEAPEATGS